MFNQRLLQFGLVLFIVVLCATPRAEAALLFCNRTSQTLEAAFAYRKDNDWRSEGWWQIQPGLCSRVLGKPLDQRFYFYYARSLMVPRAGERPPTMWAGKYALCVDNKAFRIKGDQNCEERGYRTLYFQQVDIGINQKDYTLNFSD